MNSMRPNFSPENLDVVRSCVINLHEYIFDNGEKIDYDNGSFHQIQDAE
ncbi:MAG: hypothetical protein LBI29_02575 [Rickettsiales bacterium]|nr:hypothetical protein [Rickettsiales bacterium]